MKKELAIGLFEIGAVQLGDFALHSGRRSPIYIDLRLLVGAPRLLKLAAEAYGVILAGIEYDLLAGVPYAGLPIGTAVGLHLERPLIYPRKEVKAYGTKKVIEGIWKAGQKAVIIEDLITSGDSILQAQTRLMEAGLIVSEAVVLLDRLGGGKEYLQEKGCIVHAVFSLLELLDFLVLGDCLASSERDRILAQLEI